MSNQQNKPVPYLVAVQATMDRVDSVLNCLKQPMYQSKENQDKLKSDLRLLLKEQLEVTQKLLLLNRSGKPNGIKADVIGLTTASTDYDSPEILKTYPHGKLVNETLRDLIKEQEDKALEQGLAVSETQILDAQNEALDDTKDTVTITTIEDKEGNQSKVEVDKETGDTQLYEKDKETGIWKKIGNKLKGYWINVKDFCKNIWNWIVDKFKRAKDWIKNLFKSPEDQQIIYVQK